MKPDMQKIVEEVSKRLVDDGKLIEAGFVGFKYMAIPPTASATQVSFGRDCFMAGAAHLFSSIMNILDPGAEMPTENDMRRMDLINAELHRFEQELRLRYEASGSA